MADTSRKIVYKGPYPWVSALVELLEEEGIQVDTSSPHRDGPGYHVFYNVGQLLANDANLVVVELVATGSAAAIIAGVKKFRAWTVFPDATKVEVEGDDGRSLPDGESLPDKPVEPDDDDDELSSRIDFGVELEDGTILECADEEQATASAKEQGGLVVMRQVFETPWQVTADYT
jgi:hypothetical protein